MNLKNQSYTGYWYIPSKELTPAKWYGTLHIKENNQISLEFVLSREDLYSCFPNLDNILNNINQQESIPIICGYGKNVNTQNDLGFTLLDLQIIGYSSSGLVSLKLEAKYVLTYYHFKDTEELLFSSSVVKFDGFDQWMDKNGFSILESEQSKRLSTNIKYTQPNPIELLNNEIVKIYFYFRASAPAFFIRSHQTAITQSLHLNFEYKSPIPLDEVKFYNEKIQNFFTFIFSQPTQRIVSQVNTINNIDSTASDLIYSDIVPNKSNDFSKWNFIFSYTEVEDKFPSIIQNWFQFYTDYEPALVQYFDNLYLNNGHIISRFISTLSILEIYVSRKHPNLDKKGSGLKIKLEKLIHELGEINTQLFKFKDDFSVEVNLIRKYYVHGNQVTSKIEDYMLNKEYITGHIRSLENIFKIIILIELGFNQTDIIKFINRQPWCWGI